MTDRERINLAYGLISGAGANSYIVKDEGINKVPIPLETLSRITNILDDRNYDLASSPKDTT